MGDNAFFAWTTGCVNGPPWGVKYTGDCFAKNETLSSGGCSDETAPGVWGSHRNSIGRFCLLTSFEQVLDPPSSSIFWWSRCIIKLPKLHSSLHSTHYWLWGQHTELSLCSKLIGSLTWVHRSGAKCCQVCCVLLLHGCAGLKVNWCYKWVMWWLALVIKR